MENLTTIQTRLLDYWKHFWLLLGGAIGPIAESSEEEGIQTDDQILLEDFQKGDPNAFENIIVKYRKYVYLTSYHFLRDHDKVLDVVQDIFIKLYQGLPKFRGDCKLSSWIYRISKNHCIDTLKKICKKNEIFKGQDQAPQASDSQQKTPREILEEAEDTFEFQNRLKEALKQLPNLQRKVFILRHFHELTFNEISEILKRSLGTVKSSYFLAIGKLRELLNAQKEVSS